MGKLLEEMCVDWIGMSTQPLKPEYKKLAAAMAEKGEKLLKTLNEEEKVLFEEYVSASDDFHYEDAHERFAQGFAIGALLMQEILETKAGLFGE